jgi:diguanylate cyclase (GGDEF)-like protein/PAS domain S-box-containing protein
MNSLKHSKQIDLWGFGFVISAVLYSVSFIFKHVEQFQMYNNDFVSRQFFLLANLSFLAFFYCGSINKSEDLKLSKIKLNIVSSLFVLSILSVTFLLPKFYVDFIQSEDSFVFTSLILGMMYIGIVFLTRKELSTIKKQSKIIMHSSFLLLGTQMITSVIFINHYNLFVLAQFASYTYAYTLLSFLYIHHFVFLPLKQEKNTYEASVSKLKNTKLINEEDKEVFKTLFEEAPLGYQSLDENGCFITVNPSFSSLLGYSKEELIGESFTYVLKDDQIPLFKERFPIFKERGIADVIFNMVHKNGDIIPVRIVGRISRDDQGLFKQTHCLLQNISGEVQYQRSIIESKDILEELIEKQTENFYIVDQNGYCLYISDATSKMIGYQNDELIGVKINPIIVYNEKSNQETSLLDVTYQTGKNINNQKATLITKTKEQIPITFTSKKIVRENNIVGSVISFRRYDANKAFVEKLIHMSYYDSLTGVFNRQYYQDELNVYMNPFSLPLSVVLIDINGLKLINDAFGHETGDQLIKNIVNSITKELHSNELIARLGGDEFIILLPKTTAEEAEKRLSDMEQKIESCKQNGISQSIAYGIATRTNEETPYNEIYTKAEDAMYRQKLTQIPSKRNASIQTIIQTLEEKDPFSNIHSEKVSELSGEIARLLKLGNTVIKDVTTAGLLHDIGKIVITKDILTKSGRLTDYEMSEMRKHSEIGYRILNSSPNMREISEYVLHHHERVDGLGYPNGLKGHEIPLHSKIIGVADAFDAMVNNRPYRQGLPKELVKQELIKYTNTQFDPYIIDVVLKHFDDLYNLIKHD